MKVQIEKFGRSFWVISLILLAALFWETGCTTPNRDALTGFHFSGLENLDSNKAIADDYKAYIQKITQNRKRFVGSVTFLENEDGQHAVDIKVGVNGTWWEHVLIYNKDNQRVKIIVYRNGGYAS